MTESKPAESKPTNRIGSLRTIRNRIIAGLFVVLPIFITYAVIKWLYDTLYVMALGPISDYLKKVWASENKDPSWMLDVSFSLAALAAVLAILFVAGMFFRSRLHRTVDWVLLNVPGVNTVYSAVNNVFMVLSSSQDTGRFKKVVLVQFPHPGMKAPAFVTGETVDVETGRTILCVYVPTTPIPTSGYMLMVEQKDVVELNWDLEETLQAIVSGGITVPGNVAYHAPTELNISTTQPKTTQ